MAPATTVGVSALFRTLPYAHNHRHFPLVKRRRVVGTSSVRGRRSTGVYQRVPMRAVARRLPSLPSRWGKTFIYTSQGILDNDLCSLLAIVAVAKLGLDDPGVTETRAIVELANRLAAAGCAEVLRRLEDSPVRLTPLDQALDFARSLQTRVCAED